MRLDGPDEIGIRNRDLSPRGEGSVRPSQHLLALAQKKANLAVARPVPGQVRQFLAGHGEPTVVNHLLDLAELGAEPPAP